MYDKVETIRFEGNISKIGCEAFRNCKNLKEIYFPQKVESIEFGAFFGCPSLEKIEFFEVEKIENGAFELQHPYYPGGKVEPREDGLRAIIFHNRVGTLCGDAFAYNAMLETVTGMENVELVERNPFIGKPFENKFAATESEQI